MTIRSVWHINNSQTREDSRFAPLGIMTPNDTSALSTANGVIPTFGNPMGLTDTGTMTAQIDVGRAVVQGLLTQGCYPVVVTAPEAISFTDGDAVNPRIDSVQVVIRDDPYDSSGFTDVRIVVVAGTPAASPVSPALVTTASLRLWDVRVEAGVSAGTGGIDWDTKLTDRRTYAVALGGIGVGANPGAYAGQWRDAGGAAGTLSRYNGTSWESFVRLDAGGQVVIGDTNLRRDGSNILATDDLFRIYRPAATDNAISLRTPADTGASRFFMNADGGMNWGPGGTTATDTTLYRAAADVLKSDSKFRSEVESQTTGITGIASGWSLNNFFARRTAQVVTVDLYFQRTGATISVTPGNNLVDIALATVPAGWRPQHSTISGFYDNGDTGFGGAVIGTDGLVSLRTSVGNIDNGSNVRIQFIFIQAN